MSNSIIISSAMECVPAGRVAVASRRLGWAIGSAAIALTGVLLLACPPPALAQTAGEVWAGCVLSSDDEVGGTLELLEDDVANSNIDDEGVQIAFVVVYSLDHDNDGQPVPGGSTGPVICINENVVGIAGTAQNSKIPDDSTGADTVDTLDAEDVFILRYVLNGGPNEDINEKVICHTVNDKTNCFRISPLLLAPGD